MTTPAATAPPLSVEDMLGVELVRAGGPYFGTGSPKGGDMVTVDQLQAAAASFAELRDELRPPVKLGHNDDQKELADAGFFASDGAPAAGWLDNLRVEGTRLLADFRNVPKVVADLIRAGAYRARSVELWRNFADTSGKRHPMVITGVALLGAKLPAVRGLADLVKLYGEADEAPEGAESVRLFFAVSDTYLPLADPDRAWDEADARTRVLAWAGATDGPTDGTDAEPLSEQAMARLRTAFLWWPDGGGATLADFRYLIADVVDDELRAVPAAVYIAAGALAADTLSGPDLDRMRNRLGAFYERLGSTPPWGGWQGHQCSCGGFPCDCAPYTEDYANSADVRTQEGTMPDTIAPELRSALGVSDDAKPDALVAAAVKLAEDGQAAATKLSEVEADLAAAKEAVKGLEAKVAAAAETDTRYAALQAEVDTLKERASAGESAARKLAEAERDAVLDKAIEDRRLLPSQREEWAAKYEAQPALVTELLASLTPRADFAAGEAGHDGKGVEEAKKEDADYRSAFGEAPRVTAEEA